MKVPGSVRDLYKECSEAAAVLQAAVDNLLGSKKDSSWHYESRVKSLVSFALKLETGRVAEPSNMEDLFACTIVVPTYSSVANARRLVEDSFVVHYTRPETKGITRKRPTSFDFDDLRLYVTWRPDPALPPRAFDGVTFEVQIKTFLQHAWSVATHDLVYKAGNFSWPRERVAFEVKAILEHAEVCIAQVSDLAGSEVLNLTTDEFSRNQAVLEFLERNWPTQDDLPEDRVRLARTVGDLIGRLGIGLSDLETLLATETAAGRGTQTLNLSPYGIIAESIFRQKPRAFERLAPKVPRPGDFKLFLPRELSAASVLAKRSPKHVVQLSP